MKRIKCNQELKKDELFCGDCGAKNPLFKLSNLLRTTAIVNVCIIGMMFLPLIFISISAFLICCILLIFPLYVSVLIIKNAKNYEKAGLLKKRSIVYLLYVIIFSFIPSTVFMISEHSKILGKLDFASLMGYLIGILITCLFPVLYIIFSSKLQKTYLQSKEDD